jgi:hypothetical protein
VLSSNPPRIANPSAGSWTCPQCKSSKRPNGALVASTSQRVDDSEDEEENHNGRHDLSLSTQASRRSQRSSAAHLANMNLDPGHYYDSLPDFQEQPPLTPPRKRGQSSKTLLPPPITQKGPRVKVGQKIVNMPADGRLKLKINPSSANEAHQATATQLSPDDSDDDVIGRPKRSPKKRKRLIEEDPDELGEGTRTVAQREPALPYGGLLTEAAAAQGERLPTNWDRNLFGNARIRADVGCLLCECDDVLTFRPDQADCGAVGRSIRRRHGQRLSLSSAPVIDFTSTHVANASGA